MSSYGNLQSETKSLYLKVKEGKPVDIHILTKSDDVVHEFIHFTDDKKRIRCNQNATCAYCKDGDKSREMWRIAVYNWNERAVQVFDFGYGVFGGIKSIAQMLEESGETIHQVDLRILATGSGKGTKYTVLQKPMKETLPLDLLIPKLEETVPF